MPHGRLIQGLDEIVLEVDVKVAGLSFVNKQLIPVGPFPPTAYYPYGEAAEVVCHNMVMQ